MPRYWHVTEKNVFKSKQIEQLILRIRKNEILKLKNSVRNRPLSKVSNWCLVKTLWNQQRNHFRIINLFIRFPRNFDSCSQIFENLYLGKQFSDLFDVFDKVLWWEYSERIAETQIFQCQYFGINSDRFGVFDRVFSCMDRTI